MSDFLDIKIDPEIEDFLKAHRRTFLIVRRDGFPMAYPMAATYVDGALYSNTYRKSAKVRTMERDPRIACLVLTHERGEETMSGVLCLGQVNRYSRFL